ncbi:hypothetical protein BV25DRAFT_1921629 [Artomyces pyxidatus]|uniref:Uncharacterized protein n=1 Tax=Artomyces pyxidatus TaxID=48021 RepID=A0ACB8SHD5_9AGAM|nr:hypothetical protein BV25DRAFT_1921629 [Artomyces pyxidatus]
MSDKHASSQKRRPEDSVDDLGPQRKEMWRTHTAKKLKAASDTRRSGQWHTSPPSSSATSNFRPKSSNQANRYTRAASPPTTVSREAPIIGISQPSDHIMHSTPNYRDREAPSILVEPLPPGAHSRIRSRLFLHDKEEFDHASQFRAKLERFAYMPDVSPSKLARASSRAVPYTLSRAAVPIAPIKKIMRNTKSRLLPDIPDSDLAALFKCPSCQTAWTIRKTSASKATHISICARKKGYAPETHQVLIRRELVAHLTEQEAASTSVEIEGPLPKTHLGQIIEGVGSTKRHRRPEVEVTVKRPSQSRIHILDRARRLLGGTPVPALQSTQAFGPSKIVEHCGQRSASDFPNGCLATAPWFAGSECIQAEES